MRSGGGVLLVGSAQLLVGLVLLFIYEGYKSNYFASKNIAANAAEAGMIPSPGGGENGTETVIRYIAVSEDDGSEGRFLNTPMDMIFYISIINNVFSIMGLAGMFAAQKMLVLAFFCYNAVNMVVSFHVFVDVCATVDIKRKHAASLLPYERTVAAFLFFNFVLSCVASVFAVKAVEEIKEKKRLGEYNVMNFDSVHHDTPL